jgi:hypothetical protein
MEFFRERFLHARVAEASKGRFLTKVGWHFFDEWPRCVLLRNRVRDQRRLLIIFSQCPPQLLVDFLSPRQSPHLSIRNYGFSRVLAARGIDLTGRGMGAVEEDLQFDEEGRGGAVRLAAPLGVVDGFHR